MTIFWPVTKYLWYFARFSIVLHMKSRIHFKENNIRKSFVEYRNIFRTSKYELRRLYILIFHRKMKYVSRVSNNAYKTKNIVYIYVFYVMYSEMLWVQRNHFDNFTIVAVSAECLLRLSKARYNSKDPLSQSQKNCKVSTKN